MKHCQSCHFWTPPNKINDPFDTGIGTCTNEHFKDASYNVLAPNDAGWWSESPTTCLWQTGPEFGCIHHQPKN